MKLVDEDKFGAYLGIREEFLKEFILMERNPNFEVYDSLDRNRRFVVVKSSRLPDDQDLKAGRYGIDFNRPKPSLEQALQYGAELPGGFRWLWEGGFAAFDEEEYDKKAASWDSFYSYIWGMDPQIVWVAPHSGRVYKTPDDIFIRPEAFIDTGTAGVATLCAFNDNNKVDNRIMMAIHTTGFLGAVLNLGDFGVADEQKMDEIAGDIESKYHDRVKELAGIFKDEFCSTTTDYIENIYKRTGTLNPNELDELSVNDAPVVRLYEKGLKLYGQEIANYKLEEFKHALANLGKIDVPVISNNYLHPGRYVGEILGLTSKVKQGLLFSALSVECARMYIANDPELIAEIILDVKNSLFD